MTRILVTGAAGFIGFHLCKALLNNGFEVLGIDAFVDPDDSPIIQFDRLRELGVQTNSFPHGAIIREGPKGFTFVNVSIQNQERIEELFMEFKPEIVVNLAATVGVRYSLENPAETVSTNLVGFSSLIEVARQYEVKHFIFASSSSVYGLNRDIPYSEYRSADHPVSIYGATKRANELIAHSYAHIYHLPVTGLRFFTVYGPWNRQDMAAHIFTAAILNDQPIRLFNQGEMFRDFTYVEDVVEGILKVIPNPPGQNPNFDPKNPNPNISSAPYRIFNIGNGKPVKILDFVRVLESTIGKNAELQLEPYQPGDMHTTSADFSELEQIMDYRPQTSLKEGLAKLVDWFKEYYHIS